MKITSIDLSVFELPVHEEVFGLSLKEGTRTGDWRISSMKDGKVPVQVLRVDTDDGIRGTCTVGDWRHTEIRPGALDQLRELVIGEDPLSRERLYSKLKYATRFMFIEPGWFGGFDNCLWDIAGQVAGLPVAKLLGGAKERCVAYHNIRGENSEELVKDAEKALSLGYRALKDHIAFPASENIEVFRKLREFAGPGVDLMHDAALANYDFTEAYRVGRSLQDLDFLWLEEPLPDRQLENYQRLAEMLVIPLAGPETFMHDVDMSALWLKSGAVKLVRVNARHGLTTTVKLAHFAELYHTYIEPNALGPLFGTVHAHAICGISNARLFEFFPSSDFVLLGKEMGLTNPIIPRDGWVNYPENGAGWGCEWDWDYFEKKRTAVY